MKSTRHSQSSKIRSRLNHPIIDADGHTLELTPLVEDYIKRIAGTRSIKIQLDALPVHRMFSDQRRYPAWWTGTQNALDRATAYLPQLLYARMDELGLDFSIIYPSQGLRLPDIIEDEESRRVACRAFNEYHADIFREYSDRMTPAAIIPMHTPREAIEEIEYAINVLGLKTIVIAGWVKRIGFGVSSDQAASSIRFDHMDTFGLDSEYDYDPFWAKCVELGVAPTAHATSMGIGTRCSPSNFMYNHIGHFAASGEALCKSLFMGGVTRRFPNLKFAFLEGGVAWGCSLYADIIARWRKRNPQALLKHLDPGILDRNRLMELLVQYGGTAVVSKLEELGEFVTREVASPTNIDDWAACQIREISDIHDLFVPNFYFGCEADDPMTAWAFEKKVNPLGARLRAIMGSDISHWDVPDMREVVTEAYELVETGVIADTDFRDFVFTNPVTLHGGMNPEFFKGTRIESEAAQLLSRGNNSLK